MKNKEGKKQSVREDYQFKLLTIRNILRFMQDTHQALKPSDLLGIAGTWHRVTKYLEYLLERDMIIQNKTSPRVTRNGRTGIYYYSITEKGYELLDKIRLLESSSSCDLENLILGYVDLH